MAVRQARIVFWVGVAAAVIFLILVAVITFSSGGSEYGGGH
jgi:hypothetical protein